MIALSIPIFTFEIGVVLAQQWYFDSLIALLAAVLFLLSMKTTR